MPKVRLAQINNRKDNKGTNVKLSVDIEITLHNGKKVKLPRGTYLNRVDPRKEVEFALEKGWIDEDKAQERLSKIFDSTLFELVANYEE